MKRIAAGVVVASTLAVGFVPVAAESDGRFVDFGKLNGQIQCESTGQADVVSANGLYHGLGQFLLSTWRFTARGAGKDRLANKTPGEVSSAQQVRQIVRLKRRYGLGQWPVCGRRYGDGTGPVWVTGEARMPSDPEQCAENLKRRYGRSQAIGDSVCGVRLT